MEHELFLQITPADIYYKSSKDVSKGGRRLTDMIDHFNKVGWLRCKADGPSDSIAYACSRATLLRIFPSIQISFWVAKEICGAPNLKQRVSFLKLFVHLAYVRVHRATAAGRRKALTPTVSLPASNVVGHRSASRTATITLGACAIGLSLSLSPSLSSFPA